MRYLRFGRVVDTTRMRREFGFEPGYTTEEAMRAYLVDSGTEPLITRASLERRSAQIGTRLPAPVAERFRAGVNSTIHELEAIGALPDRTEEAP